MKKSIFYILALGLILGVSQLQADCKMDKGGACPMKSGKCEKGEGSPCPIVGAFKCLSGEALEHRKDLALTDEQVKTIEALRLEVEKNEVRQMADMKTMMLDLQAKMQQEPFDAEGVKAMVDQGTAGMVASAKQSIDAYAKLRSTLTAEQVAKLKADND